MNIKQLALSLFLTITSGIALAGDSIVIACKGYSKTDTMTLYLNDIQYHRNIQEINNKLHLFTNPIFVNGEHFKGAINGAHNDPNPSCLVYISDATSLDFVITEWFTLINIFSLPTALQDEYKIGKLSLDGKGAGKTIYFK